MNEDTNAQLLEPLREVATMAAGHSATALSKLIGQDVTVAVPSVGLTAVEKISATVGPAAQRTAVGLVKITGDADGFILFSLDPHDAQVVAEGAVQQQTGSTIPNAVAMVLPEMVNILGGAILSALASFLHMQLLQSVPASTIDMIGATLDPLMAELGQTFQDVLMIQETYSMSAQGTSLKMIIILDPPSTTTMMHTLAGKLNANH